MIVFNSYRRYFHGVQCIVFCDPFLKFFHFDFNGSDSFEVNGQEVPCFIFIQEIFKDLGIERNMINWHKKQWFNFYRRIITLLTFVVLLHRIIMLHKLQFIYQINFKKENHRRQYNTGYREANPWCYLCKTWKDNLTQFILWVELS